MKIEKFLIDRLTRIRDSRLMWESMGALYNRRIYVVIAELYKYVASRMILPAGARLLDAGCGRGYAAGHLATGNPGAQITGIDYSLMQVRAARKYRRQKKLVNCAFEPGNVMNLRYEAETFDAAASIGSIKHWPDAVSGLGEIFRVLKPGGVLMVAETDQAASDDDVRRFMARFKVWFVPDRLLFWGLRHVIFGRSFSPASLAEALEKAGFRKIECLRVPACPYVIVKAIKQT